jgi:hypothetical protein
MIPVQMNSAPPLALWLEQSALVLSQITLISGLTALTVIVILGGLRGWPAWVFPNAGMLLQVSLLIQFIIFTGATIGNIPFAKTTWAWGVWLPEVLVLLAIPLVKRSLLQYQALGKILRRDWTLLTFFFYGMLPIAAIAAMDEVRFGMALVITFSLVLALGALAYLRSSWLRWRIIYLAVAFWFTWAVGAVYTFFAWRGKEAPWLSAPANGWDQMSAFLGVGGFMLALLSLPVLIFLKSILDI